MEEDLTTFPTRGGRRVGKERFLTLNSNLVQLGWTFGRNFHLGERSAIYTELSVSMNIGSSNDFDSEQRDFSALDNELDVLLDDTYKAYAYLPSLTVGWRRWF